MPLCQVLGEGAGSARGQAAARGCAPRRGRSPGGPRAGTARAGAAAQAEALAERLERWPLTTRRCSRRRSTRSPPARATSPCAWSAAAECRSRSHRTAADVAEAAGSSPSAATACSGRMPPARPRSPRARRSPPRTSSGESRRHSRTTSGRAGAPRRRRRALLGELERSTRALNCFDPPPMGADAELVARCLDGDQRRLGRPRRGVLALVYAIPGRASACKGRTPRTRSRTYSCASTTGWLAARTRRRCDPGSPS